MEIYKETAVFRRANGFEQTISVSRLADGSMDVPPIREGAGQPIMAITPGDAIILGNSKFRIIAAKRRPDGTINLRCSMVGT
jgi:hypothetical protein